MKYTSNCCGAGVIYLSAEFDNEGTIEGYTGMCVSCKEWCEAEKVEEEKLALTK